MDDDIFSLWELTFYRADNPPPLSDEYLCSDGITVATGYWSEETGRWYGDDCKEWPEVKGWAALPHPEECLEDLR
jgi:hypothetical protein